MSITASGNDDTIYGDSGADTISVSGLYDSVIGGSGSEAITAIGANDLIYTGTGADTINVTGIGDTVEAGTQGFTTAAIVNLTGANTTFVDGPGIYSDTVVGFEESSGDTIRLTGSDTFSYAVAHATSQNGGRDTLIMLNDGSTILLKSVSQIESGFFG
jgi:hypothetical protein